VAKKAAKQSTVPPLKDSLDLLRRIVGQDIEPDPAGTGRRIKEEVAKDRIISLGDPEMRHGRKSRSKLFNGYKRHIAIANNLILATAVEPANVQESAPAERLLHASSKHGAVSILDIDRAYLSSPVIETLHADGVTINSRAWNTTNAGRFTKDDFKIDLRRRQITCPNDVTTAIYAAGKAEFPVEECGRCKLKPKCTTAPHRWVQIHPVEGLLIKLRDRKRTRSGRAELRQRVRVEHRLARVEATQGDTARYRGARKNELDLNRTAAVINLFEVARRRAA
jgi:hypothetical protein